MDDLIYLGLFVVMMAATFGYVRLCDRIVGSADADIDGRHDDRPADRTSGSVADRTSDRVAV